MSETIELNVKGMSCGHCEMAVNKALKALDGVSDASADHQSGKVTVEVEGAPPSREAMAEAVKKAGYEVV